MTFLQQLKGLLLFSGGAFCNLDSFISEIVPYLEGIEDDLATKDKLKLLVQNLDNYTSNNLSDFAKIDLVKQDLIKLLNNFPKTDLLNPEEEIHIQRDRIRIILIQLGILVEEDDLIFFVVDEYPKPYDRFTGVAIAPDKADEERYGIKQGIYFRKDRLTPIHSVLTYCHEIIHRVIGRTGFEFLARGLEEGICEFIGTGYCGYKIYGEVIIKNYFITKRFKYNNHLQRFKLYSDYLRSSYFIFQRYGIQALVTIINSGRKSLKEIEIKLANFKFEEIALKRSINELDGFADLMGYLCLVFPEHEVISAKAYWVAQNFESTTSKQEVLLEALAEMENRIFAVLLNDSGGVEYNDLNTLLKSDTFRYEL